MLCATCQAAFGPALKAAAVGAPYPPATETLHLQPNIWKLQEAAESSCQICRHAWNFLQRHGDVPPLATYKAGDAKEWWEQAVKCEIANTSDSRVISVRIGFAKKDLYGCELSIVGTSYYSEGTPYMPECAGYRPISTNTGSEACLDLARKWLSECIKHRCKVSSLDNSPPFYPTRLVDLGPLSDPSSPPCLCITSECKPDGPYTTLSHCWGTIPFIVLTADNLEDFKKEIPVERLPKTFRDSFQVTRKLGVRYIWIDSLCILQSGDGARTDWEAESAQMHRIYEEGHCNIAASASSNGNGGLFLDRNPLEVESSEIDITPDHGKWKDVYKVVDDEFFLAHVNNSPLSRRAWVMQEYLFSPRILQFGRDQLFWQCQRFHGCETHPCGLANTFSRLMPTLRDNDKFDPPLDLSVRGSSYHTTSNFLRAWQRLVRAYTSCGLTKEEDKLMALAGLAQRSLELSDGKLSYYAGLWSGRDLIASLLWSGAREVGHQAPFRPKAYRAPTWSWASIENQIHWPVDLRNTQRYQQVATISHIHTISRTGHPTGPLKEAKLIMKGPLFYSVFSDAESKSPVHLKAETGDLILDVPGEEYQQSICFGIAMDDAHFTTQAYGIALLKTLDGSYRRIGYFSLYGLAAIEMFRNGCVKKEITII